MKPGLQLAVPPRMKHVVLVLSWPRDDAHAGSCRWFTGVLGPDDNAAHRDHFHLETGGWRTCR